MNDFWTNILRYPRFFISSIIGLLLIIVVPFRNLFKKLQSRIFLLIFVFLFLIGLVNIFKNMLGL